MSATDDVHAEALALREAAGLYPRADRSLVEATGRDAVAYLHRMLTQDVEGLPRQGATAALLLTPQGRIVGDPVVWRREGGLWLDVDGRAREDLLARLERYVLADDVVLADRTEAWEMLTVVGPAAPAVLERLGARELPVGSHAWIDVGGIETHVLCRRFGRRPAFDAIVPRARGRDVHARLLEDADVRAVGPEAWDVARVQEGVPAFGAELGEDVMPLEARLGESAISWTKGCYPGQEPVAKARFRGHPPHLLVRLALPAVAGGRALFEAGRKVGRVTTAVSDPLEGEGRGLGYLRHALATEGRVVEVEGGGEARVLPWRGPAA